MAKLDAEMSSISDASEAQMITTIALSDPEIGRDYYTLTLAKAPSDLDEAVDILDRVLRGKARHAEIIEARHGALVANGRSGQAPTPAAAPEHSPAPDPVAESLKALAVAVKALTDPKKNSREKEKKARSETKNGVKIPRNADQSIIRWVKGMSPCKYCGGEHLHRDCKEGDQGSGGQAQNSNAYAPSPDSLVHGAQPTLPPGLNCRPNGSPTNGAPAVTAPTSQPISPPAAACNAATAARPIEARSNPSSQLNVPAV